MCRRSMGFASGVAAALCLALAGSAHAQTCTWGGTSTVVPPSATALRAYRDLLQAPGRLAVDGAGDLYTTDPPAGRVIVRDAYGRLTAGVQGLDAPLGIAVDGDGHVYVGEQRSGRVVVFDRQWRVAGQLGRGDGEFRLPTDIAIDPATGWIYVSDSGDHAVRAYSAGGTLLEIFGRQGKGPGEFDFPTGIYVSPLGEVFVADQNNDRIQVFDQHGTFLRCIGRSGSSSFSRKFGAIQGLTGDSEGRLYVADALQGYVQVFDRSGVALGTIGSFGTGRGQLRTPMDVVIDSYNRLFVASANTARVEVFGLDGFSDPRLIPAVVDVKPDTLNRSSRRDAVTAYIELPGYAPEDVLPGTVTANGVPARPSPSGIGDYDGDGIPDLMVKFDAQAVLATLAAVPDGEAGIVVSGVLRDGTSFEGTDTVRLISAGAAP